MERLDFLIDYLLKERNQVVDLKDKNTRYKKDLLKKLFIEREPNQVSKEFIQIQDEYLQLESIKTGIKDISEAKKMKDNLYLIKCDITSLRTDAIVNSSDATGIGNISLLDTIDNCIFGKAGVQLRLSANEIINKINIFSPGQAFITPGFNLPAKYVIHTLPKVVEGGKVNDNSVNILRKCYQKSLFVAYKNNIKTVVFPNIGTSSYGYTEEIGCKIAIQSIETSELKNSFDKIVFDVFTEENEKIYNNYFNI